MKLSKTKFIIFVCILQTLFLLAGIIHVNITLLMGKEALIEMDGYDPYDPLRGRYFALALSNPYVPLEPNSILRYQSYDTDDTDSRTVYVVLEKSTQSEVHDEFSYASLDKPTDKMYIKCPSSQYSLESNQITIRPRLNTYYLNEKKAIVLDSVLRSSDSEVDLILKVLNGSYAIDGIVINGKRY